MTYTLTAEQKALLLDIITAFAARATVTNTELELLERNCEGFVAWVKGGVRPGRPH